MTSFLRSPTYKGKYNEVPDPYFGGAKGFELVGILRSWPVACAIFQQCCTTQLPACEHSATFWPLRVNEVAQGSSALEATLRSQCTDNASINLSPEFGTHCILAAEFIVCVRKRVASIIAVIMCISEYKSPSGTVAPGQAKLQYRDAAPCVSAHSNMLDGHPDPCTIFCTNHLH